MTSRGDHSEFVAFAGRILRAAERRMSAADPADLAELVELRAHVDRAISNSVRAVHDSGSSWAEIGSALGVSRQAAQQRYGAQGKVDR